MFSGMYCAQKTGNHCGKGMVFSINAKDETEKSFTAYKQLAVKMYGEVEDDAAMPYVDNDDYDADAVAPSKTCATPAVAEPSVVEGEGTDASGNACSCSCLCGAMPMAEGMGIGHYGGMGGMIPKKAEDKYTSDGMTDDAAAGDDYSYDDASADMSAGDDYSY